MEGMVLALVLRRHVETAELKVNASGLHIRLRDSNAFRINLQAKQTQTRIDRQPALKHFKGGPGIRAITHIDNQRRAAGENAGLSQCNKGIDLPQAIEGCFAACRLALRTKASCVPSSAYTSDDCRMVGFSNSLREGSLPNTPVIASTRTNKKLPKPPRNKYQKIFTLVLVVVFFLGACFFESVFFAGMSLEFLQS